MSSPAFTPFPLESGVLADMPNDQFPTLLSAWNHGILRLPDTGTHFIYIHEQDALLTCALGMFYLRAGMFAAVPGACSIGGKSSGIAITRLGFNGMFQIGGPIEDSGRLRYIDGCTDSLLIPPVKYGDACLNALYFPPGIDQTPHTHPSMRVGMVTRGSGECVTPEGIIPLTPGKVFIIHADGIHKFRTLNGEGMTVIAYHPDSNFGPQHESHPMILRTIVNGIPASELPDIQTKELS